MVENERQWFANGSATYLYHLNADLIMTIVAVEETLNLALDTTFPLSYL